MKKKDEIDSFVIDQLGYLKADPPRSPEAAQRGRAAFMLQVEQMAQGVSQPEVQRHKRWMHAIPLIPLISRKVHSPMLTTLATILLIVTILFGGGGVTVAAAQSSLPDQALYGIKLLTEDVRLGLTSNPEQEYQLELQFASQRLAELQAMLQAKSVPPEALFTRYQAQVEQAIQTAANMPDNQAIQALSQVKAHLQNQEQLLLQIQNSASPAGQAAIVQSRQMIQERLQWVEDGLQDPAMLRNQLQQQLQSQQQQNQEQQQEQEQLQNQEQQQNQQGQQPEMNSYDEDTQPSMGGNPWTEGTPTPGSGYGEGNGSNPWTEETPTPGSGYGEGNGSNPWTEETPTPGSGYGEGNGDNPWTEETPTPGSGYGDGMGGNPYTTGTPTPNSSYGPGPGNGMGGG